MNDRRIALPDAVEASCGPDETLPLAAVPEAFLRPMVDQQAQEFEKERCPGKGHRVA